MPDWAWMPKIRPARSHKSWILQHILYSLPNPILAGGRQAAQNLPGRAICARAQMPHAVCLLTNRYT